MLLIMCRFKLNLFCGSVPTVTAPSYIAKLANHTSVFRSACSTCPFASLGNYLGNALYLCWFSLVPLRSQSRLGIEAYSAGRVLFAEYSYCSFAVSKSTTEDGILRLSARFGQSQESFLYTYQKVFDHLITRCHLPLTRRSSRSRPPRFLS